MVEPTSAAETAVGDKLAILNSPAALSQRDYVMSCLEKLPLISVVNATSGKALSNDQFKRALMPELWVITEPRKKPPGLAKIDLNKAQDRTRCPLVKSDSNFRRATVFPSEAAAKDANTACIYCTYSEVFFPEGNSGANACAIATCTKALFNTRQKMTGNGGAQRDTTKDPMAGTAAAVNELTPQPDILDDTGLQATTPLPGIPNDTVLQAIDSYVFGDDEEKALEKQLAEAEARAREIQQALTEAEAITREIKQKIDVSRQNKRDRDAFGAVYDLPDVDL
jgi:hypothetical protein